MATGPQKAQAPPGLDDTVHWRQAQAAGGSGTWGAPGTPTPQWAKAGWPQRSDASSPCPAPTGAATWLGRWSWSSLTLPRSPQNSSESSGFEGTGVLQARALGDHEGALTVWCQHKSQMLPWRLQTGGMAKAPSSASSLRPRKDLSAPGILTVPSTEQGRRRGCRQCVFGPRGHPTNTWENQDMNGQRNVSSVARGVEGGPRPGLASCGDPPAGSTQSLRR